jgi:hypothetical protein
MDKEGGLLADDNGRAPQFYAVGHTHVLLLIYFSPVMSRATAS